MAVLHHQKLLKSGAEPTQINDLPIQGFKMGAVSEKPYE
jgi:hypothetical protein